MTNYPLHIAIVWHMHQPFYRNLRTGKTDLPWVRLHAAKDYLHMAEVLARYPAMHCTINMVPSLTEQMLAWAEGVEADRLAQLSEQTDWTADQKRFILNLCFSINWDNVIRRYPRYAALLDHRPAALADPEAFSQAEYRDLIAWFNLAWIDPNWLEKDPTLASLVAKGRDFSIEDQITIHTKQREIAAGVLPLYRRLAEQGQLEISTTPYFHPILPLLVDSESARRPSPGLPLPARHFAAPEDAAAQLALAVTAHTRHFGRPPRGLWPSEGAVSVETLPLIAAAGFEWLATGEAILGRSLGQPFQRDHNSMIANPRALYQPYRVLADTALGPHIIFRDHELSDRIGFLYQGLPGSQAADDMIYRLMEIRRRLDDPEHPYLVSIILDGENCWEHYEHNGDVFLEALYGRLSEHNELKPVTVSEYLAAHRPAGTLAKLATGSWIGGDLTTWIGDPEHNRAWDMLARARAHLIQVQASAPGRDGLAAPWQAIHAAEGSDWFWWYSHRNSSDQDAMFDRLFRDDLALVYEALGHPVPADLATPIYQAPAGPAEQAATGHCSPLLTGAPFPDDEWVQAAILQPAVISSGVMQRAEAPIERLFVGHDERNLSLRLELRDRLDDYETAIYLGGAAHGPTNQQVRAHYADHDRAPTNLILNWLIQHLPGQKSAFLFRADGYDRWTAISPLPIGLGEKVLEVTAPLNALELEMGGVFFVLVTLTQHDVVVAQLPEHNMAEFRLERFDRA